MIIGGGPGGNTAASYAARHGAEVVMIEKDVVGGAAHLWDCIPSKAMIATGGAMSFLARAQGMGLGDVSPRIDVDDLTTAARNRWDYWLRRPRQAYNWQCRQVWTIGLISRG